MDATQNRLANFTELFREFRNQNAHLPNRGMLKLFAEHLNLSDRYLSHVKCGRKPIGSAVARQIEERCGKPHGWMDQPHTEADPATGDERIIVEQVLTIYRDSPGLVKRLIADAIKQVITDARAGADHPDPGRSTDRAGNS